MSFWTTEAFSRYEAACGQAAGDRERLLRDATWTTRVVDLSVPEPELWAGVRASYHSLVNRWNRYPHQQVTAHAHGQPFEHVVERCRLLHFKEAGRSTRSLESWRVQQEWVRCRHGIAVIATRGHEDVAFAYVVRHGDWAYYFSAASSERNVQHAVQWAAMRYLKHAGVRWYELGWQGEASDAKGQAIEFFRRGWGGRDVPAGWALEGGPPWL